MGCCAMREGGGEESVHGVAFTIYSFSTEVKVMGGLHI